MIRSFPEAVEVAQRIEPHLEKAIGQISVIGYRDLKLRDSNCGLASRVLADYLNKKSHIVDAIPVIGRLGDEDGIFPDHMRKHVVVHTDELTFDPTYGQFMTLVGLTPFIASLDESLKAEYPVAKIAVMPAGSEKIFGEMFADFALDKVPRIAQLRRELGLRTGIAQDLLWPTTDGAVWASHEEAFDALSSIWDRARYQPQDNSDGDGAVLVQEATSYLLGQKI